MEHPPHSEPVVTPTLVDLYPSEAPVRFLITREVWRKLHNKPTSFRRRRKRRIRSKTPTFQETWVSQETINRAVLGKGYLFPNQARQDVDNFFAPFLEAFYRAKPSDP